MVPMYSVPAVCPVLSIEYMSGLAVGTWLNRLRRNSRSPPERTSRTGLPGRSASQFAVESNQFETAVLSAPSTGAFTVAAGHAAAALADAREAPAAPICDGTAAAMAGLDRRSSLSLTGTTETRAVETDVVAPAGGLTTFEPAGTGGSADCDRLGVEAAADTAARRCESAPTTSVIPREGPGVATRPVSASAVRVPPSLGRSVDEERTAEARVEASVSGVSA